jgi:hypothetical protein
MNKLKMASIGMTVFSTAAGAAAGYFYAKRKLTAEFEAVAEQEIADAKAFYSTLNKKGAFETPAQAVEKLVGPEAVARDEAAAALASYQGQSVEVVTADEGLMEVAEEVQAQVQEENSEHPIEPQKSQVLFEGVALNVDAWDIDAERMNRELGRPYVITEGEWSENSENNDRQVLTYFASDDTLVDENEAMIDDINGTVGQDNMKRFGHGCDDPNVVFIRNEKLATDFEVLRHNGSYAEEVLGLVETDDHIEHSAMPRRRRLDE